MLNLKARILGLELEHPIMNAGGTCKTVEDVRTLARSAASVVLAGSYTMNDQSGNAGNVLQHFELPGCSFSLNSLGMPNRGRPYLEANGQEMRSIVHDAGKKLAVSVAGFTPEEFAELAYTVASFADIIELNGGCPNIWKGSKQKRIACFDVEMVDEILTCVYTKLGYGIQPVLFKVSYYSDPFLRVGVAKIINRWCCGTTTTNTFANSFMFRDKKRDESGKRKPAIDVPNGLAGGGGAAVFPFSLGQLIQLRTELSEEISVAAAGGANSGERIQDYLDAGAQVVQVATAYFAEGPSVFGRLLDELVTVKEEMNE